MGAITVTKRQSKNSTAWQYRFEVAQIDGARKWVTKSGFATKKEAFEAGKIAQKNYENLGVTIQPSEMSFSDLLDIWIEKHAKQNCKADTVEGYQKKIRLYIKPKLGMYRAKAITRQNIKDFLTGMYDEGFSHNTISACKGIITNCFDYAVDNQLLYTSPAYRIKAAKKGGRPPETPTRTKPHVYIPKDQMDKIFERFPEGTPNHLALMLAYRCGLRLGEIFGIVWQDVDFENKTLQINRQVQWQADKTRKDKREANGTKEAGNGYWYFSEPKYGSYRTIAMDDELVELLKREKVKRDRAKAYYAEYYKRYYVNHPLVLGGTPPASLQVVAPILDDGEYEVEFINTREDGSYITPRTTQHTSSVIHHKLDMPDFDFHSLRHTHATMLVERKAPEVYIQRRLGHKNPDVTFQVYANHLTPDMIQDGDSVLNNLY